MQRRFRVPEPLNAAFRHAVLLLFLLSTPAQANDGIQIRQAWARETVAGQKVAGIYLELVSLRDARLIGVSSPVSGTAELHSMTIEQGVMKMRPLRYLDLPAGRPVTLAPGGNHVMLFDLKKPLAAGSRVPVVLDIEIAGKRLTVRAQARVRGRDAQAAPEGRP